MLPLGAATPGRPRGARLKRAREVLQRSRGQRGEELLSRAGRSQAAQQLESQPAARDAKETHRMSDGPADESFREDEHEPGVFTGGAMVR